MTGKDEERIFQDFGVRRRRQLAAIGVALVLVLFLAILHKYPAALGELSKEALFEAQLVVIAAFIGSSALNWRCPSCKKYLGNDLGIRTCRKCGSRLR